MLKEIEEPNQHFNAYYQDNALLIQLILNEFLAVQQLADQIHLLSLEQCKNPMDFLSQLSSYLTQLIGNNVNEESIIASSKGCLTKLKNYCYQFSKNDNFKTRAIFPLYHTIYRTWSSALHTLEFLNLLLNPHTTPTSSSLHKVRLSVSRFQNLLKHFSKNLPKITHLFWENENVMLFLLKKKEKLMIIYGSEFIEKFFKTSVKKQQIIHLISQNYTQRGFGHLVSSFTLKL